MTLVGAGNSVTFCLRIFMDQAGAKNFLFIGFCDMDRLLMLLLLSGE
jgi:hypothetical protein